jgi:hypothetical protein
MLLSPEKVLVGVVGHASSIASLQQPSIEWCEEPSFPMEEGCAPQMRSVHLCCSATTEQKTP